MAKKKRPGRPKKPPGQVRSTDLRVPVTADEKRRVQQAAAIADANGEMAAWARSVLLTAADLILRKSGV